MPDEDLSARALARVGTTIRGKYRVDRVIGVGGMAVVYGATHRNGRPVALKLLHPEISLRADLRTRFLREGHAANAVKHPGAVAVLDDDVAEDGAAFLVMELLEGETVEALWERHARRLPVDAVTAIADQLLDVLSAAHTAGIVHRDLKPANLFLTREGTVKVLDFGIARIRDVATSSQATQTGAMLGTPAYMAPEQALGRTNEVDAQTDLWAVGATLFALAAGRFVHDGDTPQAMLVDAATKPARSLAKVATAPPSFVRVIDRALAFDKAARWKNAIEKRDALRSAHREAFHAELSAAPLRALCDVGPNLALAKTLLSQPEPVDTEAAATPDDVQLAAPVAVAAVPEAKLPRLVGGTTAQPVSSGEEPTRRLPRLLLGRSRRAVAAALGAVAGLAVSLIVAASILRTPSPSPPTAAPGTSGAIEASTQAPVVSAPPINTVPEVSISDLPQVPSSQPAATPANPTAQPTVRPAASAPPAKLDCTVPFYFVGKIKKFKPECLK
jgi:serine/threonine-protein kinase